MQRFVSHVDLKDDELAGFEVERRGIGGLKNEGSGIGGFFDSVDADERSEFAGIGCWQGVHRDTIE